VTPRTPLAWRNLTSAMARTIVSLGGIGFAITLMFMQLGFLGSVGDTATVVFNRMHGDLLVRSPDYLHLYDPAELPGEMPRWLESLPEVETAIPLDMGVTQWQHPDPANGSFRAIAIMGIDLQQPAFVLPDLKPATIAQLQPPGTVLVDDASSKDFGPARGERFGPADVGRRTDVAGRLARVEGTFTMGTGLAANGALLASRETFTRLTPTRRGDAVSLVLVKLSPDVSPERGVQAVQQRINTLGGPAAYADAMTLQRAKSLERKRWYTQTPIGLIFAIGVALAVVVGGVISYLVLASDVQSHLSEYATLKAMGYSNLFLVRTLLVQSTLLALLAYPPSLLVSCGLYELTGWLAGLPIRMTWTWIGLVLLLTLVMCNTAGMIALRKLLRAEPATLF